MNLPTHFVTLCESYYLHDSIIYFRQYGLSFLNTSVQTGIK